MATIDEVARAAGVSIKTVSRVLNGEPHVRPEMARRVRAAVAGLNYRPNPAARRLAGGRSFFIAYIYNNPTPSYIALIQSGAAIRCRELGYHLVVEPVDLGGPDRFAPIERLVTTLRPDGAFLIPPLSDDPELLAELEALKLPTARIAGVVPFNGANIDLHERDGGRMVVQHLLQLGHRRIAMIGPPADHASAGNRAVGYREAMAEAGLPARPEWFVTGAFDFASGMAAGHQLLGCAQPPTAIFAGNDEMALGAMAAAHERGLDVPHDLSIVGFDDTPASASSWPPLTTVRQPLENLGRSIVDLISGTKGPAYDLSLRLIVRRSAARPATMIA